jgi:D-apiose dehydrogenase
MRQFKIAMIGCGGVSQMHFDGYVSLEEMIEGADWEVGVVCTPTPVRLQVVKTLAAAGKYAS